MDRSPYAEMSTNPSLADETKHLPPVITITPATLQFPLTPPLTPTTSPTKSSHPHPKPILTPAEPYSDTPHPLHEPLKLHLALLHPQTPEPIISFIATRLLSRDRPYGHQGEWSPIGDGHGDLITAGVGYEAGKRCERREGKGKGFNEELEWMYHVARMSYRLLELKAPICWKI
jgi:hypothetical protein